MKTLEQINQRLQERRAAFRAEFPNSVARMGTWTEDGITMTEQYFIVGRAGRGGFKSVTHTGNRGHLAVGWLVTAVDEAAWRASEDAKRAEVEGRGYTFRPGRLPKVGDLFNAGTTCCALRTGAVLRTADPSYVDCKRCAPILED